jgi:hypothetical protein
MGALHISAGSVTSVSLDPAVESLHPGGGLRPALMGSIVCSVTASCMPLPCSPHVSAPGADARDLGHQPFDRRPTAWPPPTLALLCCIAPVALTNELCGCTHVCLVESAD